MQRRAAAIYAAFFILVAAGSYAVMGVAQEPAVSVDDPDHSLAPGDQVSIDGRTYTVGEIQSGSTELEWVNESATYTADIDNDSTVPPGDVQWDGQAAAEGDSYRVLVGDGDDPSSFTLRQEFNVSQRLAEDPEVEDDTVNRSDGQEYVVYQENGTTQLLSEYLPEPETRQFAEGDEIRYQNNASTVQNVSADTVTLEWTAPRTNTVSLEDGGATTIGDTEYVAHFPDENTVELTSDVDAYNRQTAAVETYHERMSGFWGITIISGLAAILLVATAYLPSRY